MKRHNLLNLLTALISLVSVNAYAHDIEVQNGGKTIYYNYINNNTELEVTFKGIMVYGNYVNEYAGEIVIPETVTYESKTYPVTQIKSQAFKSSSVTSVTIPNGVTYIGAYAFDFCKDLTSVTIPNSVTSIQFGAFSGCSSLTSITIPNSVTEIDDNTFSGCSGLTSITIPNSVTEIGDKAFSDCSSLTSITIPNSVTEIANSAFLGCSGLTSLNVESGNTVYDSRDNCNAIIEIQKNKLIYGTKNTVIPNSVTEIGDKAFSGCSGLTSITIPNSVTKIDDGAFKDCSNLTSVTIPNSVTEINGNPFPGCSGLTSLNVESGNTVYDSRGNCNAIIKTATNELICGTKNTVIPNSVTTIGSSAFSSCTSLTSITIPNSVTTIKINAFWGCSGLTSITIPKSVTKIEDIAFYGCSNLTSVTVGIKTPLSITENVFSNRANATLHVPAGSKAAYKAADYWKEFKEIKELASPSEMFVFMANSDGTTCSVIGHTDNCVGEIIIPESWEGLSVTSIENHAFDGCSGLTSVIIPYGVTSIGGGAFYNCRDLTSVTIPNGVISIDGYAFCFCTGLTSIDIPNSVTSIGELAFCGCKSLTSITIPNKVTSIDASAFCDCRGLTSVKIPNSVTSIGNLAFRNCPGLTSIDIPNSVTSIGDLAFCECKGLISITIPNNVTSIGKSAFAYCTDLASITIPSSVTSIGETAFNGSDKLSSVKVEISDPLAITDNVFSNRTNATLYVPKGSKAAYEAADYWKEFKEIIEEGDTPAPTAKALYSSDVSAYKGTQVVLPISLNNEQTIAGFQFDLQLPTGISVAKSGDNYLASLTSRASGLSVSVRKLDSGDYRFVVVSSDGNRVTGTEGEVMNITLDIPIDATIGGGTVTLKNIALTAVGSGVNTTLYPDNETSTLTVLDYTLGDVNDDSNINVVDVAAIAAHVAGQTPTAFTEIAADVNTDGVVNSADITAEVTNIQQAESTGTGTSAGQLFVIDDFIGYKGAHETLPVILNNTQAIAGFQFDLQLPEGVSFTQDDISLASRASGLTVSPSALTSAITRFVVLAEDGSTMAAGEGGVMNIKLTIAEGANSGSITLKNIVLAAKSGNDLSAVYADDATATMTAKSFTLGDVNNDDHINVTDVVCVVDDILGRTPADFVRVAADINGNGEVNITDVMGLVDIILSAQGKAATRGFVKENVAEIDGLELKKDNKGQLSLCVKDVRNYVASQMEIRLDEGQTLEGITLNDNFKQTHQLIFARSGHSSYTVLVFSMTNENYPQGDDELLKLNISGGAGEIVVQEAMMVTREQDQKRMAPVSSYQAETGTELMDIYSLDGRLVKAQAKDTNGLPKGVYIIDGKKVIVK